MVPTSINTHNDRFLENKLENFFQDGKRILYYPGSCFNYFYLKSFLDLNALGLPAVDCVIFNTTFSCLWFDNGRYRKLYWPEEYGEFKRGVKRYFTLNEEYEYDLNREFDAIPPQSTHEDFLNFYTEIRSYKGVLPLLFFEDENNNFIEQMILNNNIKITYFFPHGALYMGSEPWLVRNMQDINVTLALQPDFIVTDKIVREGQSNIYEKVYRPDLHNKYGLYDEYIGKLPDYYHDFNPDTHSLPVFKLDYQHVAEELLV